MTDTRKNSGNIPTHFHDKEGSEVNIFLTSKERTNIEQVASAHQMYIIVQNEALHSTNKTLTEANVELTTRIEELESYEDRADNRTNTMKGLLKNFHEMDKWRREISDEQGVIIVSVHQDIRKFTQKARYHLRLLQAMFFCLVVICFEFLGTECFVVTFCLCLVVSAFQESTLLNLPVFHYPKQEARILCLRAETERIIKANDYIHEFIDQQ